MKKNMINILIIFILSIIINTNMVYAETSSLGDIFDIGSNFIEEGRKPAPDIKTESGATIKQPEMNYEELQKLSNTIYKIVLTSAIIVALIVGIYLGISMITASAAEKANIKEKIVPYVVGCAVAFGAFTIWQIVITILNKI